MTSDKFLKILIACGVTYEQLRDWNWEIEEISKHRYHCIGSHPVLARIDIIKDKIYV